MSSQHKRPLLAFVAVALLCGFVLGNAARGQAMGALAQVVPQVVVVTRVDKIAPLVVAGGAAVVSATDESARVPAEKAPRPEAAKASAPAVAGVHEEDAAREGRRDPVTSRPGPGRIAQASTAEERPTTAQDAREARDEAREDRRAERDRAREDRREAREDRREARDEAREDRRAERDRAREDRREAREDGRAERDRAREDRREAREDRRERRDQARDERRDRRDEAREDRRDQRDRAREDRRERRDQDRRDRGRSHRR